MENVDKTELLDQLARYGYDLARPQPAVSPVRVLEALLRQDDARLWEGFPVVLANVLSGESVLPWENGGWSPRKAFSSKVLERWVVLTAASLWLFRLFGVEKKTQDRALKLLKRSPEGEKTLERLEKDLSGPGEVAVGGASLSADRLKNSFRNYVVQQAGTGRLQEQKNALELELLLSELFTVRQKELLSKRLAGKPLAKTEREYYYRVVKKRLKALADERLHQLARTLVYQ